MNKRNTQNAIRPPANDWQCRAGNTQYVSRIAYHVLPHRGFTLIELLVVISVIGVLTALVIMNVMGVRERVRDSQRKSDLNQIKKALFMYKNDYGDYPADSDNKISVCNPLETINWGSPFDCGTMVYMKILPQDPLYSLESPDNTYNYLQIDSGDDFCLWATLENVSDQEIGKSKIKCSSCAVGANDIVVCGD